MFFFFFKQKTAYEMRISDWSSDVCSSDLRTFICGDDYTIADMMSYPWIVPHERQGQKLEDFPHLKRWFDSIWARPATKVAYEKGKEIGRASCRERVCQYV